MGKPKLKMIKGPSGKRRAAPSPSKPRTGTVYELAAPLFPVGMEACRDDAEDPEWRVFQNGTVAEVFVRDPSKITFAPTFMPMIEGLVPVMLLEAVCMPNSGADAESGRPICSIMPALFTKDGPKMLLDEPTILDLPGYTRLRFPIHPSLLMRGLALRCGVTITPMGGHNVRLVAAALAAIRPENV